MPLTTSQRVALRAAIIAEPTMTAHVANGADGLIADWCNTAAAPAFIVWRTRLSSAEIYDAVVWTELINRSVGERDTFQIMLSRGDVNPSQPNVRQGFVDIFSGAGGATTRANLTVTAKRSATNGEKALASGAGTSGNPAVLGFEGVITAEEVGYALRP